MSVGEDDVANGPLVGAEQLPATPLRVEVTDSLLGQSTVEIAARIRARDHALADAARTLWLETGRDLIAAKRLLGHGNFEEWCRRELRYSKSKAEKLIRASRMVDEYAESGNVTILPPPTVAYALSARSVPSELRAEHLPRLLSGEKGAVAACKLALREHRRASEWGTGATQLSFDDRLFPEEADEERRAAARSAAIDLILTRCLDAVPWLMTLLDEAGCPGVFAGEAERLIRERARGAMTEVADAISSPSGRPDVVEHRADAPPGIVKAQEAEPDRVVTGLEAVGP